MEDDISLRNSEAVRSRRLNMSRTPTTVVSEVFGFLNEVSLTDPDDSDDDAELTMSDGEVDRLFSNLDGSIKGVGEGNVEDGVNGSLFNVNGREKFLAEFRSKDSGFASLERQRCEPSSLFDSSLENEDDTEDAIESISSNDINPSISESLYDDVDVSTVPRSISMEARSTFVDDQTENAIALAADKFKSLSENSVSGSHGAFPSSHHYDGVAEKSDKPVKKGRNITIIMVKRPSVGEDDVFIQQSSSACYQIDVKNMVIPENSSDPSEDSLKKEGSDSMSITNDTCMPSTKNLKANGGNVLNSVVPCDSSSPDSSFNHVGITDSYSFGMRDVASDSSFDFSKREIEMPSMGIDERDGESCNVGVPLCSISSEDGDEDNEDDDGDAHDDEARPAGMTPSVSDQAYDSIDIISHANSLNTETEPGGECKPSSLNTETDPSGECKPSSLNTETELGDECKPSSQNIETELDDDCKPSSLNTETEPGGERKPSSLNTETEPGDESKASSLNTETEPGDENQPGYQDKFIAENSFSKNVDVQSPERATTPLNEKSTGNVFRRHRLEKNPSADLASDDSSDEDVGIYAESFRRSNWVRKSQDGRLDVKIPDFPQLTRSYAPFALSTMPDSISGAGGSSSTDGGNVDVPFSPPAADEVFADQLPQVPSPARMMHRRTDSMTTTVSETEFKCQYVSRRKCLIQRADSQQEYHRLSSRVYDQDKQLIVHRTSDSEDLGLHLLDSHPAFITSVDPGSAADKAGITEGQILVSVNDHNVLCTDHADIVALIHNVKGDIKFGVANSDFQPVRDLQAPVMSGYMHKLGNSAFKIWKKRYFVLRQDNCLYYYKNEQESDPLGAVPLGGYTISRHTDTSKDFCFKAEKYGGRTYYFIADNRDQMSGWVGALTEAAARSKKRKESFLSVSSHNVGLPALHILKPECAGFLGKLSPSKRSWRRRYCILKDACVYYYKDKNSVSALGVAHLHGYTVDAENYQRRKFSFTVQPPDKKMRMFCFTADNETDKKRWVEALIHSIQRWVKVDKEAEC